MKTPKTPYEFDYDLWTTEDGKCMVRVKLTGEVTEVDRKVMQVLRAEEKRLRRSYGTSISDEKESLTILSLNERSEDEARESPWSADPCNHVEAVITQMCFKELTDNLTPLQKDVLDNVLMDGMSIREYARMSGRHHKTIEEAICSIRKKAKKFL